MTSTPLALEGAPFSPAQCSWLSGFFTSVLGLEASPGFSTLPAVHIRPGLVYDRQHPFAADVLKVERLTGAESAKDVRLVALDLRESGLRYQAGDSLGVYPENCPDLVQAILDILGATGTESVAASGGKRASARQALTEDCCIRQSNERVLDLLARVARDPRESQMLRALLEDDADHFLDGKDVLDLLEHFPSARPAIGELIATLPMLQPRLYSISSSPAAYPDEVHLTIGVVRYLKDGCDRTRKGVASTFLAERVQPGQKVRIFVQPSHGFRLPLHGDVPIIMVGPGTGIAPFRAFLQERRAQRASGPSWLFFGDQRRACDFLYRDELENYLSTGTLTYLDTAFSRDQDEKVYVQHRMLAHGRRIWEWLERGAHVYVCGDARRMARDVDATLRQIVAEQGRRSEAEAKAYVASMARAKRYLRDVY